MAELPLVVIVGHAARNFDTMPRNLEPEVVEVLLAGISDAIGHLPLLVDTRKRYAPCAQCVGEETADLVEIELGA